MNWSRIFTIARREYLSTVRRKAFLFTIVGTPLLYALLMIIVIKPQMNDRLDAVKRFKTLGVVDSSGAFMNAPRETEIEMNTGDPFSVSKAPPKREKFKTEIRFYDDFVAADTALHRGEVSQVVVIPADYLESGRTRRYALRNNLFTSNDERIVSRWLVRGMLSGQTDEQRIQRAARPLAEAELYTPSKAGGAYEIKDDRRETMEFLLPFVFGLLLGLVIVIGGQYLLQGVNEEKESRILESMLCTVTPEELLAGKLIGLGSAGLTVAVAWLVMGTAFAGPAAAMIQQSIRPTLLLLMLTYFLLGYLFYGCLMTGIGAMASNMKEAQQFSVWFTFLTFIPFYLLTTLLGNPNSPIAIGLSLFPPTAPVSMMLRLAAPGSAVPGWQIVASIAILAVAALLILLAAARVFRVGMLMYGKTPNLPEIVRWIRTG
jgi:ABC-2 type transport system permease protein